MALVSHEATLLELFDEPAYGLELIERAQKRGYDISQARLYVTLSKMETDGLIKFVREEPRLDHSGAGGRPRKIYRRTAKGTRKAQKNRETIKALFP